MSGRVPPIGVTPMSSVPQSGRQAGFPAHNPPASAVSPKSLGLQTSATILLKKSLFFLLLNVSNRYNTLNKIRNIYTAYYNNNHKFVSIYKIHVNIKYLKLIVSFWFKEIQ